MNFRPLQSIAVILLSAMALAWSELYLPIRESLKIDVVQLAVGMYRARIETALLRRALPGLHDQMAALTAELQQVTRQVASAFTDELYLVVNPATNRLSMRRGQKVIMEAVISTGSNDTLAGRGRKWIFETPRGMMSVIRKKKNPVWIKPDWAYLEKGEPVPPWNSPVRQQKGILGSYMLDLGGGVMIHGTPAEHLLGQSVTHGCVRVGKEDLKVLFDSVAVGTKVYIY